MKNKKIEKLKQIYAKYLGEQSLEEYLAESKNNKFGDEQRITDSLLETLLKEKELWGYSKNNVLLIQQGHKVEINGKKSILKPDFETNNEFCKTPILFDAKSSNIPYNEMISGKGTVYETTFKRYLENIKPNFKYIMGFNLEHLFLFTRGGEF